jgi:hypothetical protein
MDMPDNPAAHHPPGYKMQAISPEGKTTAGVNMKNFSLIVPHHSNQAPQEHDLRQNSTEKRAAIGRILACIQNGKSAEPGLFQVSDHRGHPADLAAHRSCHQNRTTMHSIAHNKKSPHYFAVSSLVILNHLPKGVQRGQVQRGQA